jgi:hypothetical protein
MRAIAIALALALTSVPAFAARLRSTSTTITHAIVLPAGSCISSTFGPRILANHPQAGSYHNGVDLPAPEGTPVRAVASGKLLRVQHSGPGGLEVLIQHDGYVSVYSHLASVAPSLGKSAVLAGDEVGVVGHTGMSFGPHLFFALLEDGRAIDPRSFLGMPLCNGTTAHERTPAEILAAGGKLTPTRHYLITDPSAGRQERAQTTLVDRSCTTTVKMPSTNDAGASAVSCTMLSW